MNDNQIDNPWLVSLEMLQTAAAIEWQNMFLYILVLNLARTNPCRLQHYIVKGFSLSMNYLHPNFA